VADSRSWLILALVVMTGTLLYLLAPVLTPFLIAALLAYIGDPLVDRLEAKKLSRTLSVIIVFLGLTFFAFILLLILVPLIQQQIINLAQKVPGYLDWLQVTALPWLQTKLGFELPNLEQLKQTLQANWQQAGGVALNVLGSLTSSGAALLELLANLVLVPVVTFYLLRDWDKLVARIHELLPRHIEPTIVRLTRDADEVLGAFFRGQLLVMLSLGLIYSTGLWAFGVDHALLIGMIAGIVSFVPYLGLVVGLLLAGTASILQYQDVLHLWQVAVVFGVGQVLESVLLTPWLVGDRIGLHPVAVIFAVLAFGQLFGFFGVLLALPVAAVLMVIIRYLHERYVSSELYGNNSNAISNCDDGC
jgi:predicted PurR-regulated permease PerM